jgi:hypothetical protein
MEVTHRCLARRLLYSQLHKLVPSILEGTDLYYFHTLNNAQNPTTNCLFDGIHLQLYAEQRSRPEFGFCFARTAFVTEREAFCLAPTARGREKWEGWTQRGPTDSERLRVNKQGTEALYFLQPPLSQTRVTISQLRAEVAHSLGMEDSGRLELASGPFVWTRDFEEDERDVYTTYFGEDIVRRERHMKTVRGAALVYVCELTMEEDVDAQPGG